MTEQEIEQPEQSEQNEQQLDIPVDMKMQMFDPVSYFMHRCCIFQTKQGLIAIPERNIDYVYENEKNTTTVKTRSGKSLELLENLFDDYNYDDDDDEDDED